MSGIAEEAGGRTADEYDRDLPIPQRPLTAQDIDPSLGPTVSVVIPTYNGEHFLGETVDAVLRQTYTNLEVVIYDDCSTDGTFDLARRFLSDSRVSVHRGEVNLGDPASSRSAYALSSGPLVKILMHDDLLKPHAIARQVAAVHSDDHITLVTSQREVIDDAGNILPDIRESAPIARADVVLEGRPTGNWLLENFLNFIGEPSTTLFRRADLPPSDSLHAIGGRTPRFNHDVAMWLKLLALGDLAYIAEPLSQFRQHSGQGTRAFLTGAGLDADYLAWSWIIVGAKEIGFLSDPVEEAKAVSQVLSWLVDSFLERKQGNPPGLTDYLDVLGGEADEWFRSSQALAERGDPHGAVRVLEALLEVLLPQLLLWRLNDPQRSGDLRRLLAEVNGRVSELSGAVPIPN